MKRQAQKHSKLVHIIKAPIRIMSKARDFYVKSMDDFAGRVGHGGGVGGPAAASITTLPKSFSVNSSRTIHSDDDFRELVRAASTREGGGRELHNLYQQIEKHTVMNNQQNDGLFGPNGVGRSYSVGIGKIGRIDEDRTCEFDEKDDQFNVKKDYLYPRSRSHAVNRRSVGFH